MLDIADVHALFQEKGGNRMSKHVGSEVKGESGLGSVTAEHRADGLFGEAVADAGVEEGLEIGQGQGAGETLRFLDPDLHLAEGIDGDQVLPLEEVEEGLEGGDFSLDALLGEAGEEGLDVEA